MLKLTDLVILWLNNIGIVCDNNIDHVHGDTFRGHILRFSKKSFQFGVTIYVYEWKNEVFVGRHGVMGFDKRRCVMATNPEFFSKLLRMINDDNYFADKNAVEVYEQ